MRSERHLNVKQPPRYLIRHTCKLPSMFRRSVNAKSNVRQKNYSRYWTFLTIIYPIYVAVIAINKGIGLSEDSIVMISASRSFANDGSLKSFQNEELTIFPPGIPVLMGLFAKIGVEQTVTAATLNILAILVTTFITYRICELYFSPAISRLITIVLSLSYPTFFIHAMLWSEPLFTTLVAWTIYLIVKSVANTSLRLSTLAFICLLVSMCSMIKFMGFTLIPIVILGILWAHKSKINLDVISRIVIALCLSSLGAFFVSVRNLNLEVEAFGNRSTSGVSPQSVALNTLVTLGRVVLPTTKLSELLTGFFGLGIATLILFAIIDIFHNKKIQMYPIVAFFIVYWFTLLSAQFLTQIDPVNFRYGYPTLIIQLILVTYSLKRIQECLTLYKEGRLIENFRVGLIAAILLVVSLNVARSTYETYLGSINGIGFSNSKEQYQEIGGFLRGLPDDGIASTNPWLAYWISDRNIVFELARISEDLNRGKSVKTHDVLTPIKEAINSGKFKYLVIFDDYMPLLNLNSLKESGISLILLKESSEGSIFQVVP